MCSLSIIPSLHLFLSVAPTIYQQLQDQVAVQPNTATFTCSANGLSRPAISWLRLVNGQQLTISQSSKYSIVTAPVGTQNVTSTLTVSNTAIDDAVSYTCNATNQAGSAASTGSLTVQSKLLMINNVLAVILSPHVAGASITSSQSVYTANETNPVTFQCTVTSSPSSDITWYRNGAALTSSSDPRVSVGSPSQQLLSSGLYQVTQTLTITNSTDTDSGNYSCMGNNTAGSETAAFMLVVQCKNHFNFSCNTIISPSIPDLPRPAINPPTLTISETSSVTFTCTVSAIPQAAVTWFTDSSGSQQQYCLQVLVSA